MRISGFLLIAFCSIILLSCHSDTESPPAGCCDSSAINELVGTGLATGHVYVPNVFTPDNDGINDYLGVYGDENIAVVRHMTILNGENEIVFRVENSMPNNESTGWDGRIKGKLIRGMYLAMIEVETIDGTIGRFQSLVCNYPCRETQEEKLNTSTCQFPSQADHGYFNPNLPSGQNSDCFE